MDTQELYVPLSLESLETAIFPDVALYVRNGANYVLYKSHGRDFSAQDHARLSSHGIEFIYVSRDDLDVITAHMESSAERLLKSEALDARAKGKMIYQTSVNFINDIFKNPEKSSDLNRTKRLIENLMLYLSAHPEAIRSLETVMSHNYHTFVHSLQVTTLSLLIHGECYTLGRDELLDVGTGAIMHDIGKIFVPQAILTKPGRLTDGEVEILKQHPDYGYSFLKEKTTFPPVSLDIVRLHHERCDGSGYPLGLEGRDIPRSAQVTGVADVYCSLTTDKNSKSIMPSYIALQIMRQQMKGSFAPHLLDALERITGTEEAQQIVL